MRLAVITPYYNEPLEMLRRCASSVAEQTLPNIDHIFVSDGFPNDEIDAFPNVIHMRVPNHGDYGDTPRLMGALHAVNRGYDGIAFLDADNWYEKGHLELLLRAAINAGVPVATATRMLWTDEGRSLGVCTECDGKELVDTNCFLILRHAYKHLGAWGFKDRSLSISGDRVFWRALLAAGVGHVHCSTPTVNYTTNFAAHWLRRRETPPPDSKVNVGLPSGDTTQISYALWVKLNEITE
jgi:glycosyltransferase involved in cell wall biosynthesis